MNDDMLEEDQYDEIQLLLNGIGTKTYLAPDADAWRSGYFDKLTQKLDEEDNYDTMIMSEYANLDANGDRGFENLREFLDDREGFEVFEVTGDKVNQEDGLGGEREWQLRFYYDKQSCKMIMITRSHFLMTATGPITCQHRFNAIKNFQMVGTFSAASGLLDAGQLHNNTNMTLTATMIYSKVGASLITSFRLEMYANHVFLVSPKP